MAQTAFSPGWSTGEQVTTTGVLRIAAEMSPDTVFLDFSGDATTYASFFTRVMSMANGLRARGIGGGDTVVTVLDNSLDAVTSWFAINAAGAVSVPVNTAYKGEFLRHQIADARARLVIAESDYAERILAVSQGLPDVAHLYVRGPLPASGRYSRLRVADLDDLDSGDTRDPGSAPDPSDLSMLIYTAGTTGPAKGCMISHNYAGNLARQVTAMSTRRADETLWTPLPLFHVNAAAGSVLSTAMLRGTISVYPRFSVSRFWDEIERSDARMVSLLGVMIPLIAQMPETDAMTRCYGKLRIALGAPFRQDMVRAWRERFGVEVAGAPGYGNSEAAMIVSAPLSGNPVPDACGRRNDDFDVRIVDEADRELPPGEVGEIVARPKRPHVMFEGYWNRPEATAAVMRNLWFHTGDLGRFDEQGNFFFADRKKDYLRRGGENISSFEMESTFLRHPDIAEVAVHSVPSEIAEDDVKVTVVLTPGATLTAEELCTWSIDHVPYFAVPRYVEFRDALPKNPVGRVLKFQLRDEGCTPSTWDRNSSDLQLVKR
ncbi:AMP-binding protein [Rhodococcus sp. IEGM 1305]|uniref:AMP-binding protein n=1 Tax=Rhodococcus sp. IEGM 1305 TaxID=3047092 RepID=UPI0024B83E0C|nr:AMP-binding protein [Rhodococcus sp. IEGM 1305]MDI9953278.1 AMP-binding protein [Rhodococcus sp. IEGM 1305]